MPLRCYKGQPDSEYFLKLGRNLSPTPLRDGDVIPFNLLPSGTRARLWTYLWDCRPRFCHLNKLSAIGGAQNILFLTGFTAALGAVMLLWHQNAIVCFPLLFL